MECSKKALYGAMAKAFPDIEGASKDKANPHFRSKYADLGNVVDAIKPALAKHGLWFRQATHLADGGVCVETFICHESGEEISCGQLFVPANKNDAQGYGSALTYCKRYSLQTAFGVAPEDDDGNAATKTAPEAPRNSTPAPREKLAGPYTSKTALWAAVKTFDREIRSCGDVDQFEALMADKDTRALVVQIQRDAPALWSGGDSLPPEFEPLERLIQLTRDELNIRNAA